MKSSRTAAPTAGSWAPPPDLRFRPGRRTHQGMSTLQTRQPKGIPVGGQFAGVSHTESGISLTHPAFGGKYADADGTRWSPISAGSRQVLLAVDSHQRLHMRLAVDEDSGTTTWSVEDHQGDQVEVVGDGIAETLSEAKYAAKAARDERYLHGSAGVSAGDDSPWGEVETVQHIAPGLARVEAEENEGYVLSPERNANIDARWRSISGWYSAETMGHIVVASSPTVFDAGDVEEAHSVLRTYMPDEHDAIVSESPKRFGLDEYEPIKPGESFIRDWNTFWADKRDTHVQAIDVTPSVDHPDHYEVTVAAPRETYWDSGVRDTTTILVPRSEYRTLTAGAVVAALPRDHQYPQIR